MSAKTASGNAGEVKSWTTATKETVDKVVTKAQDVLNTSIDSDKVLKSVQQTADSVSSTVAAAAETVADYAKGAKDQVVDAASKLTSRGSPSSRNAGEPEPSTSFESLGSSSSSEILSPDAKRSRHHDNFDLKTSAALDANVDHALVGPQQALRKTGGGSGHWQRVRDRVLRHKRVDSSDKYYAGHDFVVVE